MHEGNGFIVNSSAIRVSDKTIICDLRGTLWGKTDIRFATILLLCLVINTVFIIYIINLNLPSVEAIAIEEMPQRFAKLIIEKEIPRDIKLKSKVEKTLPKEVVNKTGIVKDDASTLTPKKHAAKVKYAKKAVAARVARVERKMRTVGVLGMLTGTGSTASCPSVVDVLGKINRGREKIQDLDKALTNMSGLKNSSNLDVLNRKLVRSKDVKVNNSETIDDLVSSIGTAQTATFTKRGNFVIQKPESIEGAASSNAKRDNSAINKIVSRNKTSIRMSYEKYLKRNPELAGKITVRFTIAANGRVIDVDVLENTTTNSSLESDIIRKIKMWRFAEIADGNVTVTYPFVFRPS